MTDRTKAVIYLPPDQPLDGPFARQCQIHIDRRGYELESIVSDWADALALVRGGYASVVVFARLDHMSNQWEPRVEFVGGETVDLSRGKVARALNERPSDTGDSRSRRPRATF